jgi:nitrate/nitrite transporter NarK
MLAIVLLAVSNTHDFNALPYGAVLLGLAGMTFHLSQFHISNLFPRSRCAAAARAALPCPSWAPIRRSHVSLCC